MSDGPSKLEPPEKSEQAQDPGEPRENREATDERVRSFEQVLEGELRAIRAGRELRGQPWVESSGDHPLHQAHDAHLMGLSISGGGIRSATFNLGVIQGLARLGLLPRLDYLSVNSGGGYIGGWLAAWIKRRGIRRVVEELSGDACRDGADAADAADAADDTGNLDEVASGATEGHGRPGEVKEGQEVEAEPVRFLRKFSNYLTPKAGAFSADTWTMVATYLRNLFLNQAVVVLALGALLLAPRILLLFSKAIGREFAASPDALRTGLYSLIGSATLFLAFSLAWILVNVSRIVDGSSSGLSDEAPPFFARQMGVQALVVVPLFAAAWLAAQWLWFARAGALATGNAGLSLGGWLSGRWSPWAWVIERLDGQAGELATWAFLAAALFTACWVAASVLLYVVYRFRSSTRDHRDHRDQGDEADEEDRLRHLWVVLVAAAPFAGAVGGALIWTLTLISRLLVQAFAAADYEQPWHLLHVSVWQTPAIILVFMLTAFVHTGLMGRAFPERLREWWSRLGAWMLIYSITWLAFFGIAIYGPIALVALGALIVSGLSAGWIATTIAGVRLGGKAQPNQETSGTRSPDQRGFLHRLVIALAPQIFIVGLLALVALGLHGILSPPASATAAGAAGAGESRLSAECQFFWPPDDERFDSTAARVRTVIDCHSERLFEGTTPWATSLLLLVLGLGAVGLSARVDVNEFSMHLFYRNRLIRAYLGASNPNRRSQPFTGFDPDDDLPLSGLTPDRGYDGPYPIHNATLNLVAGQELAWQERKGASWVFTPLASGFDVHAGQETDRLARHGYRPTAGYEQTPAGITAGTAMGISGAAISPNMGAGSTPAMAFLLTLFNVRLGWWLGNPRRWASWPEMGPRVGLFSLVAELFGQTDERSRYVYLSDGGHFDNLGLYELVRRRCRFIIATDVGADPDLTFSGLGNAVRKCCTDFGVAIDIEPSLIRLDPETGLSRWHCAVGTIHYDRVDEDAPPGVLVYLKASLTGDEPIDSQAYAAEHLEFPHQSTDDQWFDESQFESYRKLGEHVAIRVIEAAADRPGELPVEALFTRLTQAWYPPSRATSTAFTGLTTTLDDLLERLSADEHLRFLVPQIYPEWTVLAARATGAGDRPPVCLWLPDSHEELVAGFFFCHSLIQLMEGCYLELDLEAEYRHPNNRGWINLFKHWVWAGMLRATWALTASTFGSRFQVFCRRRLGLEVGTVRIEREALPSDPKELLERLAEELQLNFLERDLVEQLAKLNPDLDQLFILRLAVTDPTAAEKESLGDGSSGASGAGRRDNLLFTFGFGVARGEDLAYLRIQDHLRKMGLARRSLRALIDHGLVKQVRELPLEQLPAWCRKTPGEAKAGKLRQLFLSAELLESKASEHRI